MNMGLRHSGVFYLTLIFCSSTACTKGPKIEFTQAETAAQKVLSEEPFAPENRMSGVDTSDDALIPNNGLTEKSEKNLEWVKRCTRDRMEEEREAALAEAKADPLHVIPVAYAFSIGLKGDSLAKYAHDRAILSANDDGITPVFIGGASEARDGYALTSGAQSPEQWPYYVTDHKKARSQYINGEKCFFSTIKVVKEETAILKTPSGQIDHQLINLYYGGIYATAEDAAKTPRLFKKLAAGETNPQFINLFVADLREFQMGLSTTEGPVVLKDFSESAVRRQEYLKSLKEMLDLQKLVTFRNKITRSLSRTAKLNGVDFQGVDGAPQLIDNLIHSGLAGIVLSTTYTPIVVDLGRKHIRTSSLSWGTFFNLAALKIKGVADLKEALKLNHFTAWLGGSIEDRASDLAENEKDFAADMQRRADDGFLVIPDADGVVRTGANLFGDHTRIDGKFFLNGFEALRYLAKKNCNSDSLNDTHLGPWDGDLYNSRLKIWVDRDRNGQSEPSELLTLKQARIAAINTCNIRHQETQDRFGNHTSLRAAVLLAPENATWLDNSDEIQYILAAGKTRSGTEVEFRVAIDIFFKTDISFYLQNVAQENVEQGSLFSIPSAPGGTPDAPVAAGTRYRGLASAD